MTVSESEGRADFMKTFFIADTHFGDENIIRYENRPFAGSADMEEAVAKAWNAAVGDDDEVFVLGDFSVFKDIDTNREILAKLAGKKYLIMGNHDSLTPEEWRECGFEFVSRYPVIYDGYWMLSHEPLYVNSNMPYANIFGHVHSSDMYRDFSEHSFCVSLERIGYVPVAFEVIKEKVINAGKATKIFKV